MGPLALGKARAALEAALHQPGQSCGAGEGEGTDLAALCSAVEHGEQILTIAVMVILLTAPLGAAAIMLAGPRLLARDTSPDMGEQGEGEEAGGQP